MHSKTVFSAFFHDFFHGAAQRNRVFLLGMPSAQQAQMQAKHWRFDRIAPSLDVAQASKDSPTKPPENPPLATAYTGENA